MAKQNALTSLLNEGEIKPSQRRSLSAETADKLRELILLEKLPPGMHIPERDLAEVLGISRTPMREALRILESEGLVDHTPTRRSRVANPSPEELAQSMKVLGTLEALGGELACTHASEVGYRGHQRPEQPHARAERHAELDRFLQDRHGFPRQHHCRRRQCGACRHARQIQCKAVARQVPLVAPQAWPGDNAAAASGHHERHPETRRRRGGDAMRAHIETAIENLFISSDEQESFE